METFKDLIIKKRKELKLTQLQLAEKIGVNKGTICKYEKGTYLPKTDDEIFIKLAKTLQISLNYLKKLRLDSDELRKNGGVESENREALEQEMERKREELVKLVRQCPYRDVDKLSKIVVAFLEE